jgi:NADH:ubiquinone oxidoreductase subunit E
VPTAWPRFYHFFTLKPAGEHTCVVCMGTACYIKGAPQLLDAVHKDYGPGAGGDDFRRQGFLTDRALCGFLWTGAGRGVRPGSRGQSDSATTARTILALDSTMTPDELQQIAETELEAQHRFRHRVHVCVAAGCLSCQSQSVKDALDKDIAQRGWGEHCQAKGVGCMGLCAEGPLVSTGVRDGGQRFAP